MATADEYGIRLTLHVVHALIALLTGAVLWALPHRAARVLAVVNVAVGIVSLLFTNVALAGPAAGASWRGWSYTGDMMSSVGGFSLVAVMWLYPSPPSGRIEKAVFGFALGWFLLMTYSRFVAKDWVAPPPGVPGNLTIQWAILSPYSVVTKLMEPVLWLFWFRRALNHAGTERRAATYYAGAMTMAMMVSIVYYGTVLSVALYRGDRSYWVPEFSYFREGIYGDPLRVAATIWLVAMIGHVFVLVYSIRNRVYVPLAILLIVAALDLSTRSTGSDFGPVRTVLAMFLLIWGITHYGLFGATLLSRWAGLALAGAFGLVTMLLIVTVATAAAPESPIALALGLALGLAAGAVMVWLILRKVSDVSLTIGEDATTTRSRIEPYHAVLQQELATGEPRESVFEKLKPLRARLGISDYEHAILEYASSGTVATRLTGHAVRPGEKFLGRYRVEKTLREGGVGVTHLVTDERVGRKVVLKTLRSARGAGALDELLKEARAMSRIDHPNVVRLLDSDVVGEEAFLVMEYVDGGSLQERLDKGKLSRGEFERLAVDMLAALEAVHNEGLVHRDIKPGNVLLTSRGGAKLADFGVAHLPGFETTAGMLPAGAIGTIRYMSPEQARGRPTTPRSDLYSLAIVLYEAWTGSRYREARPNESALELQMRIALAGPFAAQGLPPGLHAFFARALDPTPAALFGSANEMRDDLRAVMREN